MKKNLIVGVLFLLLYILIIIGNIMVTKSYLKALNISEITKQHWRVEGSMIIGEIDMQISGVLIDGIFKGKVFPIDMEIAGYEIEWNFKKELMELLPETLSFSGELAMYLRFNDFNSELIPYVMIIKMVELNHDMILNIGVNIQGDRISNLECVLSDGEDTLAEVILTIID